jgi:hypothetical protein
MAAGRADVRLIEGDGWVDWSGLATLLADAGRYLAASVERLSRAIDQTTIRHALEHRASRLARGLTEYTEENRGTI